MKLMKTFIAMLLIFTGGVHAFDFDIANKKMNEKINSKINVRMENVSSNTEKKLNNYYLLVFENESIKYISNIEDKIKCKNKSFELCKDSLEESYLILESM